MDYEKKYKEIVGQLKKAYLYAQTDSTKAVLEEILPELAESEDDKVRKEILSYLKTRKGYTEAIKEPWIAWLENIPYTIDHEKREGFHLGYKAGLEKQGEKSVKWNENTDGNKPQKHHSVLMKTTHGITEGEWNGNETWIQYRWSSSIKDSDVLFWIELSDIEKQGEQKPTDEDMKNLLRTEYEKGRADAIAEMQKEWSEEDEKILRTILSDGIRGAELDMLQVNWLKSLRPQNRWKPSDGQIRFLQAMVNDPNNASSESCQIVLKDILEKLKKLKEE